MGDHRGVWVADAQIALAAIFVFLRPVPARPDGFVISYSFAPRPMAFMQTFTPPDVFFSREHCHRIGFARRENTKSHISKNGS